jgi:membrane-bound lytic murein transglycosylase D
VEASAKQASAISILSEPVKNQPDSLEDSTSVITIEDSKPNNHTVMSGETLYSIGKLYQVAVMDLAQWNNLKLEEGIKPGQVLNLRPVTSSLETKPKEVIHRVNSSDTLYSVARQYGVTIKELMDWNQKKDLGLTIGENLKILKK